MQWPSWRRSPVTAVQSCCFLAFCIQMFLITREFLRPSATVSATKKMQLRDLVFPVLFRICVRPCFNMSALQEAGYSDPVEFFRGRSRYLEASYGWAGHGRQGGVLATVAGGDCGNGGERVILSLADIKKQVLIDTVRSVLRVDVVTTDGETVTLSRDLLQRRVSFPFNCISLDLTQDRQLLAQGVQELHILFRSGQGQSVEIHLEDRRSALRRANR